MSVFTIHHPVITLDSQHLLPAGSVLSEKTINNLILSNKTKTYEQQSLMQYSTIKNDLHDLFNQSPYNIIFLDRKNTVDILNVMESVKTVAPVLQSLDYFKHYDFYTYRHVITVFALCTLLAKDLLHDYQEWVKESTSGPSHDIGKVCVPLDILKKSDPLTHEELGILNHHSAAGYILLSYYFQDSNHISANVARDHHERRDGSGYPCGIQLTDSVVEIIAVCDIYDALISPRPYRPVAYDNRTAIEEITRMAENNVIGWEAVKALVAHNRKDNPRHDECKVSSEKRGAPPPGNVYGITAERKNQLPDSDDN